MTNLATGTILQSLSFDAMASVSSISRREVQSERFVKVQIP